MSTDPKSSRGVVGAWCLYDWANSAFPTLVITFVYATYFTKAIAPDEIAGTAIWSRTMAISAIAIALIAPVAGALADSRGSHRSFLTFATLTCVAGAGRINLCRPRQRERDCASGVADSHRQHRV